MIAAVLPGYWLSGGTTPTMLPGSLTAAVLAALAVTMFYLRGPHVSLADARPRGHGGTGLHHPCMEHLGQRGLAAHPDRSRADGNGLGCGARQMVTGRVVGLGGDMGANPHSAHRRRRRSRRRMVSSTPRHHDQDRFSHYSVGRVDERLVPVDVRQLEPRCGIRGHRLSRQCRHQEVRPREPSRVLGLTWLRAYSCGRPCCCCCCRRPFGGWSGLPDWSRALAVGGLLYTLAQLTLNRYSGSFGFWGYRYGVELVAACAPALALSSKVISARLRRLVGPVLGLQFCMILPGALFDRRDQRAARDRLDPQPFLPPGASQTRPSVSDDPSFSSASSLGVLTQRALERRAARAGSGGDAEPA